MPADLMSNRLARSRPPLAVVGMVGMVGHFLRYGKTVRHFSLYGPICPTNPTIPTIWKERPPPWPASLPWKARTLGEGRLSDTSPCTRPNLPHQSNHPHHLERAPSPLACLSSVESADARGGEAVGEAVGRSFSVDVEYRTI